MFIAHCGRGGSKWAAFPTREQAEQWVLQAAGENSGLYIDRDLGLSYDGADQLSYGVFEGINKTIHYLSDLYGRPNEWDEDARNNYAKSLSDIAWAVRVFPVIK